MKAYLVICVRELEDKQVPVKVRCMASSFEEAAAYAAKNTGLRVFSIQLTNP